jgi:hypothetical protein
MPSDLVAAARSRNADVAADAPAIRARGARERPASARSTAPGATSANVRAPAPATSRVLGNPALRAGTVLRLRADGPLTGISGGAGPGNTITVRMTGRRSLDLAAPLVRRDLRLVNAGVYNRAGGAELTLRFRDAVPAFAARAVGSTLEIILAAPSRAPGSGAVAALHHRVRTSRR